MSRHRLQTGRRSRRSVALALMVTFLFTAPASSRSLAQDQGPEPDSSRSLVPRQVELTRPIPGPLVPPDFYREAVEAGTRSHSGAPGPGYWQVRSEYQIDARLDPAAARVSGRQTVSFMNESPDELEELWLHLHQNLHAPGVVRAEANEVTGGVTLLSLSVDGDELFAVSSDEEVGYEVEGTLLRVRPPAPVRPGGEVDLDVTWTFRVPESGSGRMGHSDREVFFIGYWFPKMGVYDDLRGWDTEPYTGGAEFYDSYADYRVSISVPAGWTVQATGMLENPASVYSPRTLERLEQARQADAPVRIATAQDREDGGVTLHPDSGTLTYRFAADNVRDFTWTASNVQTWDATTARVPDRDGDGSEDRVMIHSFFRPERAPLWEEQIAYGRHSIEFLSRETGLAYPWPHMTSVEGDGIIGGGMEFPMMTVIGPYRGREPRSLYGVTVHELAHMWTPMILGSNEKRHAWMDEGFATYLAARGVGDHFPEADDPEAEEREEYLGTARAGREGAMMQHGDYYEMGYGTASYAKPATLLVTLRNFLGQEVFEGAVGTYFQEWRFKHPAPWDLFATFERAAGVDLDWFWSSWYHETWVLDHAVADVESSGDGPVIVVEDQGFAPMPALLRIETSAGGVLERTVPVDHWLEGATRYEVRLPASVGEVRQVTIDPEALFPDVDRHDNVWPRPADDGGTVRR